MKKILILVAVIAFIIGCSNAVRPGETKIFGLGSGESVPACESKYADEICRDLGWERAEDYSCRTVEANYFCVPVPQDVMFSVTCWRPI